MEFGNLTFLVAISAGLFSFLSPCVLPLVPSYLSFISGMSFEELQDSRSNREIRRKVIFNSLLFILGFTLAFVALGVSFSFLGGLFSRNQEIFRIIAGGIIVFFGIYITGLLKIPQIMKTKQFIELKNKPAGYIGSIVVGFSFAIAWTPCIGPILGAILTMAGSSGKAVVGAWLLTAYSIGLGIPFFLSSVAFGSFFNFSKRFRKYIGVVQVSSGIILVIVGVLIITGYFSLLNSYAIRSTPSWLWEKM